MGKPSCLQHIGEHALILNFGFRRETAVQPLRPLESSPDIPRIRLEPRPFVPLPRPKRAKAASRGTIGLSISAESRSSPSSLLAALYHLLKGAASVAKWRATLNHLILDSEFDQFPEAILAQGLQHPESGSAALLISPQQGLLAQVDDGQEDFRTLREIPPIPA